MQDKRQKRTYVILLIILLTFIVVVFRVVLVTALPLFAIPLESSSSEVIDCVRNDL